MTILIIKIICLFVSIFYLLRFITVWVDRTTIPHYTKESTFNLKDIGNLTIKFFFDYLPFAISAITFIVLQWLI